MKRSIFLLMIISFITSCGSINDAGKVLRNEKIRTTDEFLVKKRNPLVLPPSFEEVPEPGTITKKNKDEEEKIREILKSPKKESNQNNKSSSLEESILKSIRK